MSDPNENEHDHEHPHVCACQPCLEVCALHGHRHAWGFLAIESPVFTGPSQSGPLDREHADRESAMRIQSAVRVGLAIHTRACAARACVAPYAYGDANPANRAPGQPSSMVVLVALDHARRGPDGRPVAAALLRELIDQAPPLAFLPGSPPLFTTRTATAEERAHMLAAAHQIQAQELLGAHAHAAPTRAVPDAMPEGEL